MAGPSAGDAFGRMLLDHHRGLPAAGVIERDDGFVHAHDPAMYFAPPARWGSHERRALRFARGRVLDVGCGAGRHALYLQDRGHDVVAIDVSPAAVRVSRERGVRRALKLSISDVGSRRGTFDTIVLMGNNFGLLENPARGGRILGRFARITSGRARIIATTLDPYQTDDLDHLRYHRRNRARGRMGGQVRLRARYRNEATPWFDYLLASRDEVRSIVEGTGWAVSRFLPEDAATYAVVIEKT